MSALIKLSRPLSGCSLHKKVATHMLVSEVEVEGEIYSEIVYMCKVCATVYIGSKRIMCSEEKRIYIGGDDEIEWPI